MITKRFVNECFEYTPDTGVLVWKERPVRHFPCAHAHNLVNGKLSGKEAGATPKYYRTGVWYKLVCVNGKNYMAHELICLLVSGYIPHRTFHIDGDGLNNRWDNLRFVGGEDDIRDDGGDPDTVVYHNNPELDAKFKSLLDLACWHSYQKRLQC